MSNIASSTRKVVKLVFRERPMVSIMLRLTRESKARSRVTNYVFSNAVEHYYGVVNAVARHGQNADDKGGVYLQVNRAAQNGKHAQYD